jgi:hypothetical protein
MPAQARHGLVTPYFLQANPLVTPLFVGPVKQNSAIPHFSTEANITPLVQKLALAISCS